MITRLFKSLIRVLNGLWRVGFIGVRSGIVVFHLLLHPEKWNTQGFRHAWLLNELKRRSGGCPRELLGYLERKLRRKQWMDAEFILKWIIAHRSDIREKIPEWLEKHIVRSAKHYEEYGSLCVDRNHAVTRISQAFGVEPDRLTITASRPVFGGRVGFQAFKHKILVEGKSDTVFEKIYHPWFLDSAKQEVELFRSIPECDLHAPKCHGLATSDPFVSVVYQYIEGRRPNRREYEMVLLDLAIALWRTRPGGVRTDSRVSEVEHWKKITFNEVRLWGERSESRQRRYRIDRLLERLEMCFALADASPECVVHGDFGPNNILIGTDGQPYLIDWDKWRVGKVGTGIRIETGIEDFLLRTGAAAEKEINVSGRILRNNIGLYNLTSSLQDADIQGAAYWADQLMDEVLEH